MPFSQELLFAVAFSDVEGVRRLAAGADLDEWTKKGETLLLAAIRDAAPAEIVGKRGNPAELVGLLLELGADPNRPDRAGWTPWMACLSRVDDRVVRDDQLVIRDLLAARGVDRGGEELLHLVRDAAAGDLAAVRAAAEAGVRLDDPRLPSLAAAASGGQAEVVEFLLGRGVAVEPPRAAGDPLSLLIQAAYAGHLRVVQLLVAHGAEVAYSIDGGDEATAEGYARQAGHEAVAEWLAAHTPPEVLAERARRRALRKPKYRKLFASRTNGSNYDLTTEAIVARLDEWDTECGLTIVAADASSVTIRCQRKPADPAAFARQVHEFCPDCVEQGLESLTALEEAIRRRQDLVLWWD